MRIYKYLDEKGTLKTLENGSVLLKCPEDYNDPFDSLFLLGDKENDEAYKLYVNFELFKTCYRDMVKAKKKPVRLKLLMKSVKKEIIHKAPIVKQTKQFEMLPRLSMVQFLASRYLRKKESTLKQEFKKTMNKVCSDIRKLILVSCFTLNRSSILMWSHYANKHRGACFEYEFKDKNLMKVEYADELPKFKLLDILKIMFGHEFADKDIDTENKKYSFLLEPIYTKSLNWKYEEEVRYIYSKNRSNERIIDAFDDDGKPIKILSMPKIKRIYIGCKADANFISKVRELAGNIPIIKMRISKEKYLLEEIK